MGSNSAGIAKARRNGSSTLPGSTLKDVTNAQSSFGQYGQTDVLATVRYLVYGVKGGSKLMLANS